MKHQYLTTMGEFWELHPKLQEVIIEADRWAQRRGYELNARQFARSDQEQLYYFEHKISKLKVGVHQRKADAKGRIRAADFDPLPRQSLN